jgi:hypothetical protein
MGKLGKIWEKTHPGGVNRSKAAVCLLVSKTTYNIKECSTDV